MIFENSNFDFYDATQWWDGRLSTKKPSVEVYTFFAEIEFQTEHINLFKGDVLLMR